MALSKTGKLKAIFSYQWDRKGIILLIAMLFLGSLSGCLRYSFTGSSIPEGVSTIYIPFFPDQSNSGLGNLSDRLNDALVDRFVNQSSLQLANSENGADVILEGSIVNFTNEPFSVGTEQEADLNEVTIQVRATYQYTDENEAEWSRSFTGTAQYDPAENPIQGEINAADQALGRITDNMFNASVSNW